MVPTNPRTLAEQVADRIRDAIIRGELPSGQPLKQAELAARFGVSPIPLREGLRLLEAERFVTLQPFRGAVVTPPSAEELRELADMFMALQTMALRLGVPRMTEETLRQAEEVLEAMKTSQNFERWGALSVRLHVTLCAAAGRPRLLETIRGLLVSLSRYRLLGLTRPAYRERSERRSGDLLEACRRGDPAAAVRILEKHVGVIADEVVGYLEATEARLRPRRSPPRRARLVEREAR